MAAEGLLFIGVQGTALALDRATGTELWRTELKGGGFVNVVLDGDKLLAATRGELFCLDAATGQLLWRNKLKGLGLDIVTIASSAGTQVVAAKKKKDAERAAAAAAGAGAAG